MSINNRSHGKKGSRISGCRYSVGLISVFALWVMTLSSCSNSGKYSADPKKSLTEYISYSFAVKSASDRPKLLEYLTGESKQRLSAWSDEQFQQAFVDSKRKFVKLAFHEVKNPAPNEAAITYELVYLDQSKGRDAKVTNKKLCRMVQQDGRWLIRDVRNIKELVEYSQELSLP